MISSCRCPSAANSRNVLVQALWFSMMSFRVTALSSTWGTEKHTDVPAIGYMTTHDYIMTMRSVKIAELKARLSEHLRYVRRGHVVTILDRDTPVARVVPMEGADAFRVRQPAKRVRKLQDVPLPRPLRVGLDVVDLLLEERQGER